jgi:hypothetical protein
MLEDGTAILKCTEHIYTHTCTVCSKNLYVTEMYSVEERTLHDV